MKSANSLFATMAVAAALCSGCSDAGNDQKKETDGKDAASEVKPVEGAIGGELHIYTWSDYIAPELI